MKARRGKFEDSLPYHFGVPMESAMEDRERFAAQDDFAFGEDKVFPELVEALLAEVPEGSRVLEVGAATGLLTGSLLERAGSVTAMELSEGLLRRLLASEIADDPRLSTINGMVEDLPREARFEHAVVTFTPRRGMGLMQLLLELAEHVEYRVVVLLDDDGSLDWAYLARAASQQGADVRLHLVTEKSGCRPGKEPRRGVILVVEVSEWRSDLQLEDTWEFEARTVDVEFPQQRGTATQIIRYFLSGGDRALLARTDPRGMERLYGNLRTAAHRIGRDEVTVRLTDDGVQIVRLPRQGD